MNVNRPALSAMNFALMAFFFVFLAFNSALQAEEDVITDIILINGLAELVDLNPDGEVLQRHLSIPDYFSSGRSHKRTLRESLAKTKVYGVSSEKEIQIEAIVYKAPVDCRQSLMRLTDTKAFHIHDVSLVNSTREVNLLEFTEIQSSNVLLPNTTILNQVVLRNPLKRQRTLFDDRLEYVSLVFKPTDRTSKAIIDV